LFAQPSQPSKDWVSLGGCSPQADIRVTLVRGGSLRGSFQNASAESLVMTTTKGELTLSRQDIKRVQLKRSGHRGRHALIGLAVGAGGGLIGVAALHDAKACSTGFCVGPDVAHDVKLAVVPVGALIGAMVGAALPSGGWTDIYRAP
jgi:hypothetical protein